jgi:hypothetical protein
MRRFAWLATGVLPIATALAAPRDAAACGGCFSPPVYTERTVVTDHRMAFAISPRETILWDQIRYSGNPREFAWVLPVKPGATLEISNDAWFAALDASTQPVVTSPAYYGGGYGCSLTGCSASESAAAGADYANPGVQVLTDKVVGPYETVTLRATDPRALETWLDGHGYAIPPAIQPTIDAYTSISSRSASCRPAVSSRCVPCASSPRAPTRRSRCGWWPRESGRASGSRSTS